MEEKHVFESAKSSVTLGKSSVTGEPVLRQHKSRVFQAFPPQTDFPELLCHCWAQSLQEKPRQGVERVSCAPGGWGEVEKCLKGLLGSSGRGNMSKALEILYERAAKGRKGWRCQSCHTPAFLLSGY